MDTEGTPTAVLVWAPLLAPSKDVANHGSDPVSIRNGVCLLTKLLDVSSVREGIVILHVSVVLSLFRIWFQTGVRDSKS